MAGKRKQQSQPVALAFVNASDSLRADPRIRFHPGERVMWRDDRGDAHIGHVLNRRDGLLWISSGGRLEPYVVPTQRVARA